MQPRQNGRNNKVQARQLQPKQNPRPQQPTAERILQTSARPQIETPSLPVTNKLINDQFNFQLETVFKGMTDNTDFVVVGVIGAQGVGKSTVMSLLQGKEKNSFPIQTKEQQFCAQHSTSGIDIAVTPERIILLDTQPILSASVLADLMKSEAPLPQDYVCHEQMNDIQSFQIALLLFSVCHVVVVVQDTDTLDLRLWHFLQTTSMLKTRIPDLSTLGPGSQITNNIIQNQRFRNQLDKIKSTLNLSDLYNPVSEYYPNLVFLLNKCPLQTNEELYYQQLNETFQKFLGHSQFGVRNALTPTQFQNSSLHSEQGREEITSASFFTLPIQEDFENQPFNIQVSASFSVRGESFRNQALGIICNKERTKRFSNENLSEKEWLKNASQIWSFIRKSPLLFDFAKFSQSSSYRVPD